MNNFLCLILSSVILIGVFHNVVSYKSDTDHLPYLDQDSFDELLKKPNFTVFVHAYKLSQTNNNRFVKNFHSFGNRLKKWLQRFDITAQVYATNCLQDRIDRLCLDDTHKEYHLFHGFENGRNVTRQINHEEKLSERSLVKEALRFINPMHLDGCEDVVLSEMVSNDPLFQDDENEIQIHKLKKRRCEKAECSIDFKDVKRLCKKSFQTFLTNNNVGMVLFHLNVDTTSNFLLENFIAASTLGNVGLMGSVACNDWPDLCEEQNVHSWPKIWIYKNQKKHKEYMLPFDPALISNTLKIMTQPAIKTLNNVEEIENFLAGKSVDLSANKALPFVTTGFFSSLNDKEYRSFAKVAEQLHGSYVFGVVFGDTAQSWLKQQANDVEIPTLITTRVMSNNMDHQNVYHKKGFDESSIKSFIKKSTFPTVVELTTLSFPPILKRTDLLITAVFPNGIEKKFYNNFEMLAEQFSNIQFSYIDRMREPTLTCKLVKACHLILPKTPFVLAKTSTHIYMYQTEEMDFDIENLKSWIQAVEGNTAEPTVTLKSMESRVDRPLAWDYYEQIYGRQKIKSTTGDRKFQDDMPLEELRLKTKTESVSWDMPRPARIVDEL